MFPIAQVSQHAVPLQISMGKGVATRTAYFRLPMLLPEMIWLRLWNSSYFKTYILEDANMLPRFWASCGQHPGLLKHPVKRIPKYQHRAVPVVLHGDGAAVTLQLGSNSKSCLFLSFRSLTASTPKHFLMAAVWTSACGKSKSFNTSKSIFNLVSKSFAKLFNLQCTGGFFPVPVWTTGDLEYFSDFHQIARWNSLSPCSLCSVTLRDLKKVPTIDSLSLEPEAWREPRAHASPLFTTVMTVQGIAPDWMHSKHLGMDLRLLGSVLWLFIFALPNALPMEQRLHAFLHEAKVSR